MHKVVPLIAEEIAGNAGWQVVEMRREKTRIHFSCRYLDHVQFDFWIMPDDGHEACLAATGTFRLGYRSDRFEALENNLLKKVYRCLVRAEEADGPLDFELPEDVRRGDETEGPALIYADDQFEIRVTLDCNERCIFCNSDLIAQNMADGRDAAMELLDRVSHTAARKLVVTGGEPLLVPWLPELITHARNVGFGYIVVQSNGVGLARPQELERLRQAAPDEVLISIHGSNEEIVGSITGRPDLFARKMAGYRASLDSPWKTSVSFVLCKQNLRDMPATMELLAAQPSKPFIVSASYVSPAGRARLNWQEVVPRMSEAAPYLLEGLRRARNLGMRVEMPEYCGIPTCVEPLLREFAEPCLPDRLLGVPEDKALVARCHSCPWRARCSGIFRAYLELFGDSEFALEDGSAQRDL